MSVIIKNLSFVYSKKTPYEKQALTDINLTIADGEFVAIIGHTGSGKSTLIQHINGLIKTQTGQISVFDIDLMAKKPDYRKLRQNVGMVFQYPEYQLFEETVEKDIAFGPKNIGMPKEEIASCVKDAIELVGLDYNAIKDKSPFEISGGQKRRVAIAGVIAMQPKILILDEPTAGLDPQGKEEILNLILNIRKKSNPTIIMIGHNIDELSRFAKRFIVLDNGKLVYDLPPSELFEHSKQLTEMGLDVPVAVKLNNILKAKGIDLGAVANEMEFTQKLLDYKNKPGKAAGERNA